MLLFYRLHFCDMNRCSINIKGNNQIFPYVIEYTHKYSDLTFTNGSDVNWHICEKNRECIHVLSNYINYYRHKNDWYKYIKESHNISNQYIPENINTAKLRVYIPNHSISTYKRGVKYALTAHTYINGYKIDLGSFIFNPTDTIANKFGKIKYGNNEYSEYIEFCILDPFYIVYSDEWLDFRYNVCKEPKFTNNTGSLLCVSLYVVNEYDERFLIDSEYSGGISSFNISDYDDFLNFKISYVNGSDLNMSFNYNHEYNWLLTYLKETYDINCTHNDIKFEIVLKSKDAIGAIAKIGYNMKETNGSGIQTVNYNQLISNSSFSEFFSSWKNFYEGWNFAASMTIYNKNEEIFNIVSNELPITQEIFSKFVNGGSEKIIDLDDMEIKNYNVVNKIENKIIQVERPNDSKSNIIQPVFFRVKETELLTLHPAVTENICINLDDYKSKVTNFTLMINGSRFIQIGANNYGIIFKVTANKIDTKNPTGVYYILDDNMELITTGKYNCVI